MAAPAHMEEFDELLQGYYGNNVAEKKKTSRKNYEFVDSTVRDILREINSTDKRFCLKVFQFGSFCQKLTVGVANEFQYAVKLKVPGPVKWVNSQSPNYTPRTYSFDKSPGQDLDLHGRPLADGEPLTQIPKDLKVVPSDSDLPIPEYAYGYVQPVDDTKASEWKDLMVNGDVIPFLAKQRLQKLIRKARTALDLADIMEISRKVDGSNLTFTLHRDSRALKVHFEVMIQAKLPIPSWFAWPRPNTQWPSPAQAAAVKVNLRATGNFYWRESYAEARTELIKDIDSDGGRRKKVFCIVEQLNRDFPDSTILSVQLKNLWMWQLQTKPSAELWQEDQVSARVLELIYMLLDAAQKQSLPHFIDQRRDMFLKITDPEDLDRTVANIEHFLNNPEMLLNT